MAQKPAAGPDARKVQGHRSRLRSRFLRSGIDALEEYEALELLLTYAIPRKDVKPLAKALQDRFGSVSGLLDATGAELLKTSGFGIGSATLVLLVKALCVKYLEQHARGRDLLAEMQKAADFIRMKIGGGRKETLMVLYLDARHQLLAFRCHPGTVDQAAVYVRNVVKEAIDCGASGVILAHNHPSGVCEPTASDLDVTRELAAALKLMGIAVYDHLLVTPSVCRSLLRNFQLK